MEARVLQRIWGCLPRVGSRLVWLGAGFGFFVVALVCGLLFPKMAILLVAKNSYTTRATAQFDFTP